MTLLPGLTSTRVEGIEAFLEEMRRYGITQIALFPTCLDKSARVKLYEELERFKDLHIPHVHIRTDYDSHEMRYLAERFGTTLFNIHPRASSHPFGSIPPEFAGSICVENVNVPPEVEELQGLGGLCPDFSHLENAVLHGHRDYVQTMDALFDEFPVRCCHVSAIRIGVPNAWNGEWDHHEYKKLSDLDYFIKYKNYFPPDWASLELENSLPQQLEAIEYLKALLF